MLNIHFAGWFQVRLPTDPDPTDEKRGISGYTFALPGEPDFDRIVRLHDPMAPRSYGPEVGVFVRSVWDNQEPISHPLDGARVQLLDDPKFEMRNYVLTDGDAGTEAIDPFHIRMEAPEATIDRIDHLDLEDPNMPIAQVPLPLLQRRGGAVELDEDMFRQTTGFKDFLSYRRERRANLERDLAQTTDPIARAGIQKRLVDLAIEDPNDRRMRSLSFKETRSFSVNGRAVVTGDSLANVDLNRPWPITFWNGVWDCDTLCGYMAGTLSIPVVE